MKYPIGIQSFSDIIEGNYAYVDKTQYVYELATGSKFYFLSRPRRFGKSLLISTLKAYFGGRKDLFKGLAIEQLEKDWTEYPLLYLNFNTLNFSDEGKLENTLRLSLTQWERIYGKDDEEINIGDRFKGIIKRAYEKTGQKVVVLVDEYDKPLLDTITDKKRNDDIRKTLKEFYSVLKGQDEYLRFVFLTGVTRFSHVSIFSDLNHLKDISLDPRYAEICGVSEKELKSYFKESVKILARANKIKIKDCYNQLKDRYDGYHFYFPSNGMYNPFSLLWTFDTNVFNDYWFASGTPTFLAELLTESAFNIELLEKTSMTADMIGNIDNFEGNPIPILYQSGYLTIKGYDTEFSSYFLSYPNKEVEVAFTSFLLPYYANTDRFMGENYLAKFIKAVREGHPDDFLDIMKTLFDGKDFRVAGKKEIYFQNCMYLIFKLMGFHVQVEYCTSRGRIDILLGTKDYLYVMELKVNATAEDALRQIDEKDYMLPFKQDHRKLVKIGVAFDLNTRTLTEWHIEGL